jgi:hypothetical protein
VCVITENNITDRPACLTINIRRLSTCNRFEYETSSCARFDRMSTYIAIGEGRSINNITMDVVDVAHYVVGVAGPVEDADESGRKNSNRSEQSHRDALQNPYHPPPCVGSRRARFWRSGLPDYRTRCRRDGED